LVGTFSSRRGNDSAADSNRWSYCAHFWLQRERAASRTGGDD